MVVPPGFEPRSEEPESSMMDRYTKGLWSWETRCLLQFSGLRLSVKPTRNETALSKPKRES